MAVPDNCQVPVIAIAVGTREKIDRVMPKIDEMIIGGMITLETTTMLRYVYKHKERETSKYTGRIVCNR